MPSILELRQQEFNQRFSALPLAKKQSLTRRSLPPSSLHIVYILNHTSVCGGVKVILEHATYLSQKGARVTLVSHFPRPAFIPFIADYIQIPFQTELTLGIPPCDLIIATYWDHIQSCIDRHIAPVIYFEQGDYHLFDRDSISLNMKHFIDVQFSLAPFIITVSHHTAELIEALWGRQAEVYPNAVNTQLFNPSASAYYHPRPYILMVGSDASYFKGLPEILTAYTLVTPYLPDLDLIWVSPTPLSKTYSEPAKVIINPPQEVLASLYHSAFVFISASHYESFSLPVLEAMSCSCPVITTPNRGVTDYAKDYINCLYTPINNPASLADNILKLAANPALANTLIQGGLKTAGEYSWQSTISKLFAFYKEAAQFRDILSPE